MRKPILLVTLLVPVTLAAINGCGPRAEVAKQKVLDQIDDLLGKMDVQKAEIDAGMTAARQAADGVRRAKYKAQADLDQLDEKVRPFQDKIARCDETLAKLRDLIRAGKPADIAGKTYTVADLKEMAGKVIESRRDAEEQVKGFDAACADMRIVVATITRQQQELDARITRLQAANAKLEAEMAAARAMRQASSSMGDDGSLHDNLDAMDRKMASLSADARAELAVESERWATGTDKAINDVDAFIKAAATPADPLAEIDRILVPANK